MMFANSPHLHTVMPCLRAHLTLVCLDGRKINEIVSSCDSPFFLSSCILRTFSITHRLDLVNY